ncbi:response regulator transcription factor [Rhodocyclaceae bacterium SMB388]
MTRILIVEDHALVREAMAQTLARLQQGVECVEVSDSEQALACLEQSPDWDLAVVDLMLPDLNGFSLLGVMAKRFPDVPAVVVSALDDVASVRRAMRAGASGFVSKASPGDVLREAVRTVLNGGIYAPDIATTGDKRRPNQSVSECYGLTAAQTRVVELLGQGKTNREIADLLTLSEGTVKVHMSAIFRAMNVRNRAQVLVALSKKGNTV